MRIVQIPAQIYLELNWKFLPIFFKILIVFSLNFDKGLIKTLIENPKFEFIF